MLYKRAQENDIPDGRTSYNVGPPRNVEQKTNDEKYFSRGKTHHDCDSVAKVVGLVHVVCRQHDGAALLLRLDEVPKLLA